MKTKYNLQAVIAVMLTSDKTFDQAFVTLYPNVNPDKVLTPQQHIYVANVLTALNAEPLGGAQLRAINTEDFYQ